MSILNEFLSSNKCRVVGIIRLRFISKKRVLKCMRFWGRVAIDTLLKGKILKNIRGFNFPMKTTCMCRVIGFRTQHDFLFIMVRFNEYLFLINKNTTISNTL